MWDDVGAASPLLIWRAKTARDGGPGRGRARFCMGGFFRGVSGELGEEGSVLSSSMAGPSGSCTDSVVIIIKFLSPSGGTEVLVCTSL